MMRALRLIIFLGIVTGLAGLSCAGSVKPDISLFDSLITKDVIAGEFDPRNPLDFSITSADNDIRHFVAEYHFKRRHPLEHYTVDISVTPAGRFLDPGTYQRRKDVEAQGGADLDADYPPIGLRAQRNFFGAGPGGAAYGLTFTTSDGRFDVRIIIGNLMPEEVEQPRFDLDGFAQRLSDRYDAKAESIDSATP